MARLLLSSVIGTSSAGSKIHPLGRCLALVGSPLWLVLWFFGDLTVTVASVGWTFGTLHDTDLFTSLHIPES